MATALEEALNDFEKSRTFKKETYVNECRFDRDFFSKKLKRYFHKDVFRLRYVPKALVSINPDCSMEKMYYTDDYQLSTMMGGGTILKNPHYFHAFYIENDGILNYNIKKINDEPSIFDAIEGVSMYDARGSVAFDLGLGLDPRYVISNYKEQLKETNKGSYITLVTRNGELNYFDEIFLSNKNKIKKMKLYRTYGKNLKSFGKRLGEYYSEAKFL